MTAESKGNEVPRGKSRGIKGKTTAQKPSRSKLRGIDPRGNGLKMIIISIILAFALWYATFIVKPFNFWLMMTFNTLLLSAVSFCWGGHFFRWREWSLRNILVGVGAAAVLYGIFFTGHHMLVWAGNNMGILPHRAENLNSIYANREIISPALIAALLFFPIGFGEEIFWRGFVQKFFQQKWGKAAAFIVTLVLYTGVHVPTANPVLILAAFICGAYWGGLYCFTGSLVPVIVSHMVWDPFIFIIFPIR